MITIYTKHLCPHCVTAKNALKAWGLEYTEINIEEQPEAREFLVTEGHRSVPQIYWDKELLVAGGALGLMQLGREQFQTLLEGKQNVSE